MWGSTERFVRLHSSSDRMNSFMPHISQKCVEDKQNKYNSLIIYKVPGYAACQSKRPA